jgi:hypothetical protein
MSTLNVAAGAAAAEEVFAWEEDDEAELAFRLIEDLDEVAFASWSELSSSLSIRLTEALARVARTGRDVDVEEAADCEDGCDEVELDRLVDTAAFLLGLSDILGLSKVVISCSVFSFCSSYLSLSILYLSFLD